MTPDIPWPKELPRFAEAFRIIIDHASYRDTRILTGEWQMAALWHRVGADFLPLLARAGRIGVIASTAPRFHSDYSAKVWYGDQEYPEVMWHPDGLGGLQCITSEDAIADWCKRRKVPRALFDVPASQEWRG